MAEAAILRWQVWLADSDPPIWRRFQVSNQATLDDLHQVLQRVMGWHNSHLHAFNIRGDRYAPPLDPPLADTQDSTAVTLANLNFKADARFTYTYDFGDGWLHLLTLEAILVPDASLPTPHCLEGERACPPEDCGGVWGYEELLEQLGNPDTPDYEDLLNWVGADFDPEVFPIEAVNQQLNQLR
ncbi:MAG: plasmid pRiA4b ORF-3 family protein [Leptolyngbya sp. SIO1E4]|nr:plasmid pRiA4b ORF-3 family protein [Leptolyngbya sp. SIO1E4]